MPRHRPRHTEDDAVHFQPLSTDPIRGSRSAQAQSPPHHALRIIELRTCCTLVGLTIPQSQRRPMWPRRGSRRHRGSRSDIRRAAMTYAIRGLLDRISRISAQVTRIGRPSTACHPEVQIIKIARSRRSGAAKVRTPISREHSTRERSGTAQWVRAIIRRS